MFALPPLANEPVISLPTARLLGAVTVAAAITGSLWVGVTLMLGQASAVQTAGLVAAAIVAAVTIAGLLAITPWKTRPISAWMTFWLAGMVIRMLATPALTFLLYSAIPLNAPALTLSVAIVYLVVLMTEAIVVARHVGRADQNPVAPRPHSQ